MQFDNIRGHFHYNQAVFEVRVNDDWQTAEVDARAWINWSLADDIRSDLDSFLEDFALWR